jgi:hypothetical protein
MSSAGTKTTAATNRNGESSAKTSRAPYALCEIGPAAVVAAAASIRPISIDPESPMKIRAGWKLCGRNPRQAPARTTDITAGG